MIRRTKSTILVSQDETTHEKIIESSDSSRAHEAQKKRRIFQKSPPVPAYSNATANVNIEMILERSKPFIGLQIHGFYIVSARVVGKVVTIRENTSDCSVLRISDQSTNKTLYIEYHKNTGVTHARMQAEEDELTRLLTDIKIFILSKNRNLSSEASYDKSRPPRGKSLAIVARIIDDEVPCKPCEYKMRKRVVNHFQEHKPQLFHVLKERVGRFRVGSTTNLQDDLPCTQWDGRKPVGYHTYANITLESLVAPEQNELSMLRVGDYIAAEGSIISTEFETLFLAHNLETLREEGHLIMEEHRLFVRIGEKELEKRRRLAVELAPPPLEIDIFESESPHGMPNQKGSPIMPMLKEEDQKLLSARGDGNHKVMLDLIRSNGGLKGGMSQAVIEKSLSKALSKYEIRSMLYFLAERELIYNGATEDLWCCDPIPEKEEKPGNL